MHPSSIPHTGVIHNATKKGKVQADADHYGDVKNKIVKIASSKQYMDGCMHECILWMSTTMHPTTMTLLPSLVSYVLTK